MTNLKSFITLSLKSLLLLTLFGSFIHTRDYGDSDDQVQVSSQIKKINELYLQVQNEVLASEAVITTELKAKIASLQKAYSKKESEKFLKFLDDKVTGFRYQCHTDKTIAVSKYFDFLHKNDATSYTGALTQDEQLFIDGLTHIANEAIVRIQGLALDLTAKDLDTRLGVELQQAFYDSAIQAQRSYEEQKERNKAQLDSGWLQNLQKNDTGFLSEFSKQFKKTIVSEAKKQSEDVAKDIGSSIFSRITGKPSAQSTTTISPSVMQKIQGLGTQLKSKGLPFLFNDDSSVAMIALKRAIRIKYPAAKPAESVTVRTSKGLCKQEENYLKNRMPKVQKVLSDAFGITEPLRIAFCCSGGGNRAMVGTLGMFLAASKHNFLQASVYCAGLSGSTWTIAPWSYLYLKGLISNTSYDKSLTDLQASFMLGLNDPSMMDPTKKGIFLPPLLGKDVKAIFADQITTRFGYDQHMSLVDIWAAHIGNFALKLAQGSRLQVKWSEIEAAAQKGNIPLPLCSAAFGSRSDLSAKSDVGAHYDWLETGPFEAGSTILGYVPMKYFGCEFKDGSLDKNFMKHEYPLSFWLGVYGSAFSLTLNDVIEKGLPTPTIDVFGQNVKIPVDDWLKKMIQEKYGTQTSSKRLGKIHAQVPNFSVGLQKSLMKNKSNIGLFDGGLAFNIPLPLVLDRAERGVDIVIMYDSNPGDINTLKSADEYFKRKKIAMPTMGNKTKEELLAKPMTVFNDPRNKASYKSSQPTLIYFPTDVDTSKPPYTTANFKYNHKDFTKLVETVYDSFESQVIDMTEILQKVAKARYSGQKRK